MEKIYRPFDSVILAGGFGTRLSPLTETIPKPMLPMCGESVFSRIVSLIRKNGFLDTAVTTMYLPEQVEAFEYGSGNLTCFREEQPLGSAGAVRELYGHLGDNVLIISGDAVCDFDLRALLDEHIESGCGATVVLAKSSSVCSYGSVILEEGCITAFCEKPSLRDLLSDLVNTGIYILSKNLLELIPKGTFYDFGRDFFPMLLKKGIRIRGTVPEGYWYDIGSFSQYYNCNMMLSGGENCISGSAVVSKKASIFGSIIFDGAHIGGSILTGCIVAENARIGDGCIIPAGCVIGAGAVLPDGVCLSTGSVLMPGETASGNSAGAMFPSSGSCFTLGDGCIICDSEDLPYTLGRCLADELPVAVGYSGAECISKAGLLATGVRECGTDCCYLGDCSEAICALSAGLLGCSCSVHISQKNGNKRIRIFDRDGMPICESRLKKLAPKSVSSYGRLKTITPSRLYGLCAGYLSEKLPKTEGMLLGVCCPDRCSRELIAVARLLSAVPDFESGDCYFVSEDGRTACAITESGEQVSHGRLFALACMLSHRREVFLPNDAPDSLVSILDGKGISTVFYGDSDSDERKRASEDGLYQNGISVILTVAAHLHSEGRSLSAALCELPRFSVLGSYYKVDRDDIPSLISAIREEHHRSRAGFDFEKGSVSVFPSAEHGLRLVISCSMSEYASELSGIAEERIREHLKRLGR